MGNAFEINNGVLVKYHGTEPEVVIPQGVTVIGEKAFRENQTLVSVVIPQGVTEIGDAAFQKCTGLRRVEVPESVKKIGVIAFRECGALEEIKLPRRMEALHTGAFRDCKSLTRIELPEKCKIVSFKVFGGCEQLADENGMLRWNDAMLEYFGPGGEVVIPEDVRIIGMGAFFQREDITGIHFHNGLKKIMPAAFHGCKGLKTVEIPGSVAYIGAEAFSNCVWLKEVRICAGVKEIAPSAFFGDLALERVEIPDTVSRIGDHAFCYCKMLGDVSIPNPNAVLEYGVFSKCKPDDRGFVIRGTTLYSYLGKETEVVIPDGIRTIDFGAFRGCRKLERVVIPASVTRIGSEAFGGCRNLKDLVIPDTVEEIGKWAFLDCEGLCNEEGWTIIRGVLYDWCGKVRDSVTIPGEVKRIEMHMSFNSGRKKGNYAKELTIPASVEDISGMLGVRENCLEVIRAYGHSLREVHKEFKPQMTAGYACMVEEGVEFSPEIHQEYLEYATAEPRNLYPQAAKYPQVLRYMTGNNLIPGEDADVLLEMVDAKDVEIKSVILDYKNRRMTQGEGQKPADSSFDI